MSVCLLSILIGYRHVMVKNIIGRGGADSLRDRTLGTLRIGIIIFSIYCILALVMQNSAINIESDRAIRGLGRVYMSVISEQLASHFGTVTEMNLKQAVALVNSAPPSSFYSESQLRIKLSNTARSSGFDYLSFITTDNELDVIYGPEVRLDAPDVVETSLASNKYNVSTGKDTERNGALILISVPVAYELDNKVYTKGIIVGISSVTIKAILDKDLHGDILDYYIIRDDGSIVLESQNVIGDNYFDRVKILYDESDTIGAQQYLAELTSALRQDREYSNVVTIGNARQYIYCTNLPNSYWHLIVKIPNSLLDNTINDLTAICREISIIIGGSILIILLLGFALYFIMTKKQIHDLANAKMEAERLSRAKSDFLSNMSHDIRTPMNGIIGMTKLALESIDNPKKVRSYLKKVSISSNNLLNMLNDMLDMAKIESGALSLKVESTSLKDVVQNVKDMLWAQVQDKKLNFRMLIDNIVYENVCADSTRLIQIMLNVAGNAVKFTPEGGDITIMLKEEESQLGDKYIKTILIVKDNGIGISEEFLPKIFDAFEREDSSRTTEAAGAGMGLALTKFIVDALQGTIDVESECNVGSTFTITLDIEKGSCNEELNLDKCHVLLIEADEQTGYFDSRTLTSTGLEVDSVTTLNDSYDILKKNGDKYKLILLSWDSTGDVDTKAVQDIRDRLKELNLDLPIIVLSNRDPDELDFNSSTDIADGFIVKPLFKSSVYYNLRSFMGTNVTEKEEVSPSKKEFSIEGMNILIAEDNEFNSEIAVELLKACGCTAEVAENGKICYDKFVASEIDTYDVILMDIRMPEMDGREATQAIRKLDRKDAKTIPIIAVSADAFEDDKERSYNSGLDAHLSKPMNINQVIEAIRKVHEERQEEGGV